MPCIFACDIDNMLTAFPNFFKCFVPAMQAAGCKVGILTARPQHEQDQIEQALVEYGISPDFIVCKPDGINLSDGVFKATVCNELGVDYLFDDFECDNPQMLADFFATATRTEALTGFAYDPKGAA